MMSPNHQSQFLSFLKENKKSKMAELSGSTYVQNQRPKVATNLELQSKKRLTTPEVERHLYTWVKERQKIGGNISREMVKKKALQIQSYLGANNENYPKLKFGDTWIFNFLKRCNLGSTTRHGHWTWTENSDQKQSNFDDEMNWDLIKSKLPSISISRGNSENQIFQKFPLPATSSINSETSKNQAHKEEIEVSTFTTTTYTMAMKVIRIQNEIL